MSPILIIGAQGMLGRPVTRRLVQDGFMVRALVRRPEAAKRRSYGVAEVVTGDLQDVASLDTALHGCAAVYLSVDSSPREKLKTETDGLRNLITAAKNHPGTRLLV